MKRLSSALICDLCQIFSLFSHSFTVAPETHQMLCAHFHRHTSSITTWWLDRIKMLSYNHHNFPLRYFNHRFHYLLCSMLAFNFCFHSMHPFPCIYFQHQILCNLSRDWGERARECDRTPINQFECTNLCIFVQISEKWAAQMNWPGNEREIEFRTVNERL